VIFTLITWDPVLLQAWHLC